jgi:tripartite-type tricarboxylate transporter receptor subunit TctC
VPTFVELGLRDFDVDLWFGVLAPAGTPKDIVDHYNAVLNEILSQPRIRAVLDKQGLIALA